MVGVDKIFNVSEFFLMNSEALLLTKTETYLIKNTVISFIIITV